MKLKALLRRQPTLTSSVVNEERILSRYRLIMGIIGFLYPLWRFTIYFLISGQTESWSERGFIGVLFLVATLATYAHPYFRKNIATVFDIVAGVWTLQVFLLIWRSELDSDFLQVGLITIFCVGSTFLDRASMLKYYLLCLVLTGYTVYIFPDEQSTTFFFGVLIALTVSYVSFLTLLTVFTDLRQSQETLAKRTKEFEELSAAVQTLFLPNATYIKERGFELAGYYRPATACGGDWWSFFVVHDESVSVFVGDVTGHGPGSAMMTASVASYLKAIRNTSTTKRDVPDLLNELNHYLLDLQRSLESNERYLMTMSAIELNLKTKRVEMWSAGAPFPYFLKSEGTVTVMGNPGHPLGLDDSMKLGYDSLEVDTGDRLFLYTDGIAEMKIGEDRQLGERRLAKLIQNTRTLKPQEACASIEKELDRQKHGTAQDDDFTYVILDIT